MSSETKKQPINGSGSGGFRAKLNYYLHSGEKKHVAAGIAIIGVILGLPWYLTARGINHRSHQDYLERADKARSEKLYAGTSTIR